MTETAPEGTPRDVERGSAPFSLLVVCTGNVCRSPAAERLLAGQLGPSVTVRSAGTRALRGAPIAPPMARLVQEAGYRTDAFEARQLTEDFIRCASLVLTATRDHRRVVCEHLPSAVRRTFTLREFARLVASADLTTLPAGPTAVRLATAIPYALEQRGRYHVTAEDDGVVDPYGATESLYRRSFSTIESAVTGIAQALA